MDLCIWDKCNNRCVMCTNPYPSWSAWDGSFDYDYDALIGRIEKDRKRFLSNDSIYLTGGEPTIHPNFLDIVKYLKNNFLKQRIKILTNGRRFYYEDFVKCFLKISSNIEVDVSLHGHDGVSHDRITGVKKSFDQAFVGLKYLLKHKQAGQIIGIRFVVNNLSYKNIRRFLEIIYDTYPNIDRVILIFWEAEEQAVENLKKVKINFNKVRPYLDAAYDQAVKFKDFRLYHFPLCTIQERFWRYAWITLPDNEIFYPSFCSDCDYQEYCMGVQRSYEKFVGLDDVGFTKKGIAVKKTNDPHHPIRGI